ncbi:VirB4 family type IV secretion/conjugal transfer ATPase [Variovorax saccharolyticus]|uniref:VirB4 family type IV secretion/conjugal transfer ATPase n=1 Tax=Variovorax saccharolyticus TaxID=3053516 RepID=UPI002574A1A6|nr:VirB4 family type IV secretion/conjugal transfer ATPase [Variovorax sp. J22R187]MDM0022688.1 VirB4 family type IV secretion/conjugal transfer ATPase [Variovorax sp. J22R187]
MTLGLARERLLRRETSAAAMIPLVAHLDTHVARTHAGDYVQTLRLAGASFESADDEDLNNWHERLNVLWRNIASPNLALWTHVIRRRESAWPQGRTVAGFAREIDERYRRQMADEHLMVNELYLSVVFRPQPTRLGNATLRLLRRTDPDGVRAEMNDSLDECAKKRQELLAALERYDPEVLGVYRREGSDVLFSSLLEFHGLLINGEWQRMPLPRAPLNEVLATSRPFFGNEAMEYRTGTQTRVGAFLGIKEYPTPSAPGMFSALLTAPFPFILTQSFTFLGKGTATDMMSRQHHRMAAAGDLAVSQAEELKDALDDLMSNRFVVGDHHFTLHVLAQASDGRGDAHALARIKQLNDNVARARYLLGDTGMVVAREDLALEAAFWAQLPGNFAYRPRKAPITSRNFAGMSPFHNFPTGRATGNYWGDALALFVTRAGSPFFFSLHASDPRRADGGSRRDVGHVTGVGPVGTGKTTLLGFCMVAICNRLDATQVIFDKDEGLHILVRALGGRYLPLKNGVPTGCNPLQLDDAVADNVEFMRQWLRRLVLRSPTDGLTVRQEEDLAQALRGTLRLEMPYRRLSRLAAFLDVTDPEGVHARLRPWCAAEQGDYAWVFDNPEDEVVPVLDRHALVGFDVTDFLDHEVVRAPLTMYLFHLVNRMVDGRPLVCWMDEFAKLLNDPAFAWFAKNGLETWRKKNASIVTFTQSASHVLDSVIARAIVEQTPTKVLFPNPEADHAEYTEGFSLTDREFALIKQELEPGSRQFLIKQNHVSVVAQLDLQGFDDALQVISGRTANVRLMREVIEQHGPEPARWLPAFRELVSERKNPGATVITAKENLHA